MSDESTARVSKHPDERREEILAKSLELFTAQGFDSTSVQNITDAVGVAKGLFYHYFDSKQEALNAAVEWQAEGLIASLPDHASEMEGDALSKIRGLIGRIISWKFDEHRDMVITYLRVMYRPENYQLRAKMMQEYTYGIAALFAEIITEGNDEGVCNAPDPEVAAETVFNMWIGGGERLGAMMLELIDDASMVEPVISRIRGWESGVERLLGIADGTLGLYDYEYMEKTLREIAPPDPASAVDDGIPPPDAASG